MLVVPGIFGHLRHLSFSDLVSEDPADALTLGMDLEHDPGGVRTVEPKELFQNIDHKLHGGVIVVEQYHPVQRRLLDLRLRLLYGNAGVGTDRVLLGHGVLYRGRETATQERNNVTSLLLQKQSLESASGRPV